MRLRLGYREEGPLRPVGDQLVMRECVEVEVHDADPDWPAVSFRLVAEGGGVHLDCLAVERREGGRLPYGTMREVLAVLPDLVRQAIRAEVAEDLGDGYLDEPAPDLLAPILGTINERRNAPTADKLARVEALYDKGGAPLVVQELGVSRSHVYRLLKQARERTEKSKPPGRRRPSRKSKEK